jgi:spermidine synthase
MVFAWATNDSSLRQTSVDVLRERFAKSGLKTRYYTPDVHQAAFALPQYVIETIK